MHGKMVLSFDEIPEPLGDVVPCGPRPVMEQVLKGGAGTNSNPYETQILIEQGLRRKADFRGIYKVRLETKDENEPVLTMVWLNDPEEANKVLLDNEKWIKGPNTSRPFSSLVPKHIIAIEGDLHRKLRTTAQRCLNDQIDARIFQIAQKHCKRFEELIVRPASEENRIIDNLDKCCRALALDIISETLFGDPWNAIENYSPSNQKAHALAQVMHELHWRVTDFSDRTWKQNVRLGPVAGHLELLEQFSRQAITMRRANLTADLVSSWIRNNGELSDEELANLCMTFLTMGHENIATAMAWTLILLAENADAQEMVRNEILQLIKDGLNFQNLSTKLPRSTHAFHEAVRLYPSVPVLTRTCENDTELCGYHIPKGTEIVVSLYSLHRNRNLWGETCPIFDPTREPRVSTGGFPDAAPFGMGSRACLGRPLSYIEAKSLLCAVLSKYEMVNIAESKVRAVNFVSLRPGPHAIRFKTLRSKSSL